MPLFSIPAPDRIALEICAVVGAISLALVVFRAAVATPPPVPEANTDLPWLFDDMGTVPGGR
ncbi:hypothetical protein BH23GEM3_BH23GEM3_06100 [soil metagenome]|nr:hypothetical protein [Gemmatimonadota bacterium]